MPPPPPPHAHIHTHLSVLTVCNRRNLNDAYIGLRFDKTLEQRRLRQSRRDRNANWREAKMVFDKKRDEVRASVTVRKRGRGRGRGGFSKQGARGRSASIHFRVVVVYLPRHGFKVRLETTNLKVKQDVASVVVMMSLHNALLLRQLKNASLNKVIRLNSPEHSSILIPLSRLYYFTVMTGNLANSCGWLHFTHNNYLNN